MTQTNEVEQSQVTKSDINLLLPYHLVAGLPAVPSAVKALKESTHVQPHHEAAPKLGPQFIDTNSIEYFIRKRSMFDVWQ